VTAEELPNEYDSLPDLLTGERVLAHLAALTTPRRAGAYRRVLVVNGLTGCDSCTGLVLRACIDLHLEGDPGNRAQIWEPKDAAVWRRLHDLLSPLPDRCELVEDQLHPARDPEIIVPAFRIEDPEQAMLLGQTIARAHTRLGVEIAAARAAAEAIVVFADNARVHGADSRIGVTVACVLEPDTRELQLVALDLGQGVSADPEPVERLRELVARSRRDLGGLASLIMLAERRRLDVTLRLATGAARARWATSERLRYEEGPAVPGFVASFTVRL
jgi:hypothetical protein